MDLRCFVSVELPDEVKKNIDDRTKGLRDAGSDVKWVQAGNLHITLKFLGKTPESLLPDIKKALTEAVSPFRGFQIELVGTGVFPNEKYPRVIWIGIRDADNLIRLWEAVEMSLAGIGFEPEQRKFKPHLTLGRVREARPPARSKTHAGIENLIKEVSNLKEVVFGEIEVSSISIMKSELSPKGPRYERLEDVELNG